MGSSASGNFDVHIAGMVANENQVGRPFKYCRSFDAGSMPTTFQQSMAREDQQHGWRSGWSWNPGGSIGTVGPAIISGAYDARIRAFVQSVPLGHKLDFCIYHECNTADKVNAFSVPNQIDMFQSIGRIFDEMRADGVPQVVNGDVISVLCLSNSNFTGHLDEPAILNRYDDAVAALDMFTLDAYGKGLGLANRWPALTHEFFTWWDDSGKTAGTGRLGLWEASCNDTTQTNGQDLKIEFIQQATKGMFDAGAECFSLFDSNVGGSQPVFNKQIYADTYRVLMDQYGSLLPGPDPDPVICPIGTDKAGLTVPVGETIASWCNFTDPGVPVYRPQAGLYSYQSWT